MRTITRTLGHVSMTTSITSHTTTRSEAGSAGGEEEQAPRAATSCMEEALMELVQEIRWTTDRIAHVSMLTVFLPQEF